MPISRAIPGEFLANLWAFHIRFRETQVAAGARPVLPDGAAGITDEEAVATVLPRLGVPVGSELPPDVQVAARYGLFSHDVFAKGQPGVPMRLVYQDRPAWIVSFFGPGVRIGLPAGPSGQSVEHHVQNIVIDAATGDYLMGFH